MPLAIAVALSVLLIMCGIFEYMKLLIISNGIRDAVESAVIATIVQNYDEAYAALREGYSADYQFHEEKWQEQLDYGNVYARLDDLLGLKADGKYHVKYTDGENMEFRLYDLDIKILNPALGAGQGTRLTADAQITVEIPVAFANKPLLPLKLRLTQKAAYTPRF